LPAEEIYQAIEQFYREFYFRPAYMWKKIKQIALDPHERPRLLAEGKQFLLTMWHRRSETRAERGHPAAASA
jgi:hypothetical protein